LRRAVTGTRDGDVVLWEEGAGMGAADRRAVKILRIHLEAAITALTVCGPYVVSGWRFGLKPKCIWSEKPTQSLKELKRT
jgi:hypothetical protein